MFRQAITAIIILSLIVSLALAVCRYFKSEDEAMVQTEAEAEISIDIAETGVAEIDAEARALAARLEAEVVAAAKETGIGMRGLFPELKIRSRQFSFSGDIKSLVLQIYQYLGEGYGNSFYKTWTYDSETGRVYGFRDLFQEEHNPLWTIYPKVRDYLMENLENPDEEWIARGTGEENFGNYANFAVSEDELVIFLASYQAAAYIEGSQEISIPAKDLQAVFKPPFLSGYEERKEPSRPAETECRWTEVSSHGVQLLSQECGDKDHYSKIVPVPGGFAVQTERGIARRLAIEVIEKSLAKSPERTIEEKIIYSLPSAEARTGCRVKRYEPAMAFAESDVERFVIAPYGTYKIEVSAQTFDDPAFEPCGPYGTGGAVGYFEYHKNYPSKILFVLVGQDAPLFDEQSIEISGSDRLSQECLFKGGKWMDAYSECEVGNRGWCEAREGRFYECESPCRYRSDVDACAEVCVPVCKFR